MSFVSLFVLECAGLTALSNPSIPLAPPDHRKDAARSKSGVKPPHSKLLINSLRAAATADCPAHLARYYLGFSKHSQEILAENLPYIRFAVAALQQFISNIRQHGNVARAFGKIIRAVKVR